MTGREVLFEITVIGETARVAAIDVATGVEVVTMGPVSAGQRALETLALRKLERVLNSPDDAETDADNAGRPGRLV